MNLTYQTPNIDTSWEELRKTVLQQADLIRSQQIKSCQCHTIDANKVSVLMWADTKWNQKSSITKCSCAGHTQNFILKIAQQKFRGLIRTDKYKAVYWKFRNLEEEVLREVQAEVSLTSNPTSKPSPEFKEKLTQLKAKYAQIREADKKESAEQENSPVPKVEPELNHSQEEVKENVNNQQN